MKRENEENRRSEMMKRIAEVIKRREELESNKEVKKELLYRLNEENFISIVNSDEDYDDYILIMKDIMNLKILIKEDYEHYKGDMNYHNELIVSTQQVINRLKKNLLSE